MTETIDGGVTNILNIVRRKIERPIGCGRITLVQVFPQDLPRTLRRKAERELVRHYNCFRAEVMESGNVRLTRSKDDST